MFVIEVFIFLVVQDDEGAGTKCSLLWYFFLVVQDDEGAGTKCSLLWYSYFWWCRMMKGQGRSVRHCGIDIFRGAG